jgi:hypothetical protein
VHGINAGQYKYRRSSLLYRDAEDNPFAEPLLVYGYVKKSYAIFTTYDMVGDMIRELIINPNLLK